MPRTPVDYSKTLIYKLVHKEDYDNANIYVGSTTDFRKRKNNHKSSCSNEKNEDHNDKKYQYIRDNGGWECFNMIEVEKYPCNDGNEARAREEYWRCYFNSQLNTKRAYRTDEQRIERYKKYYENNKDTHNKYTKEHYQKNKDKLLEKITCECGCIINKGSLTQHLKTQKHLTKIGVLKYEFVDDNEEN